MDNTVLNMHVIIDMIGDKVFTPLIWVTIFIGFIAGLCSILKYSLGESSLMIGLSIFVLAKLFSHVFTDSINFQITFIYLQIFLYSLSLGVLICYLPWWFKDWYQLYVEMQNLRCK